MAERFQVESVRPDVFLDKARTPVNGYTITVFLPEYQETHEVRVLTQEKAEAKRAIDKLIAWRDGLNSLED